MTTFILFLCCLLACLIGALSGLGGGIIIKPVVDILDIMSLETLGFLSNCTVFTMALVSLFRNRKTKINLDKSIPIFLGIGSIIGGILGKNGFTYLLGVFSSGNVAIVQYVILLTMNICILLYVLNKHKIKTKQVKSKIISIIFGTILGIMSSFLGIGGGPINIAMLYYFYSLSAKEATITSLVIIFFSQTSSLIATIIGGVPTFNISHLVVMCLGAVVGAILGGHILRKMDNSKTQSFFVKVLIFLIILSAYNLINYLFL